MKPQARTVIVLGPGTRPVPGGYEVRVGSAGEAIAVLTVGIPTPCDPGH